MKQWLNQIRTYVEENAVEAERLLKDLSVLPAPSGKEERRSAFIKQWLEAKGAKGVYVDDAGNVIYPYEVTHRTKLMVYMAHMDIVFPDEETLLIKQQGNRLCGPGVGDDTANLVNLLMAAAYFAKFKPSVETGILFVANTCEEGLGNLKGCRQLMKDFGDRVAQVISFDLYLGQLFNQCVGSLRYEISLHAQGGHSFACFGNTNAVHQLSQVVCRLYEQTVPAKAPTTYNVGSFEGGTSVNTIPEEAKLLYEIRSVDRDCMEQMRLQLENIIREFQEKGFSLELTLLGERPCAGQPDPDRMEYLISTVASCIQEVTGEAPSMGAMSTDANIPLSLDIPALTFGTIIGGGAHTRSEWIELSSLKQGMLLALQVISSFF